MPCFWLYHHRTGPTHKQTIVRRCCREKRKGHFLNPCSLPNGSSLVIKQPCKQAERCLVSREQPQLFGRLESAHSPTQIVTYDERLVCIFLLGFENIETSITRLSKNLLQLDQKLGGVGLLSYEGANRGKQRSCHKIAEDPVPWIKIF